MANQHHIFAYGDVFNEQSKDAPDWGIVNLTDIKNQVSSASNDADEIVLHIHSRGGDVHEGFAIHDYLRNTGKKITTITEGLCASIATVLMLAGDERQMTKNSTFMIHNPQLGFVMGDADDLESAADFLRSIEEKIINFYSEKTGQSRETLDNWMKEEKFMTPEEALDLGFITNIVEEVKAVAYANVSYGKKLQTKTDNKMNEILNSLVTKVDNIINKLGIKKPDVVNELRLSTADGKVLIITTDADQAAVNDKVRLEDDNITDGDYTMPDGEIIVVKDATIIEIRGKDGENVDKNSQNDIILQLQNEINILKEENSNLNTQLGALNSSMTLLLDNIESNFTPPQRDASFVKKDTKTQVTDTSPNFDEALSNVRESDKNKNKKSN